MAEVHIVDIDGEQWNIKDLPLTTRVENLEAKTAKNFEYSTTEQKIGKWLDGKDHYRLVITGNTQTHSVTIPLANKNIAEITKINGMCNANNQYCFPIPYFTLSALETFSRYYAYLYYDISNKQIDLTFGQASYFDNTKFNLEIEYTKNS